MSKGLFRLKNYPAKFFNFRSHRLSKLLFSTIVALVVISTAHAAGPLRVNPANPRYFFDSNGTAVYLGGTYLPHEEIELGTSDFTNYLDFLQQQKHNFTRLWAWEQTPSTARNPLLTLAYERTGPGLALDGGAKFDLRRFNQNHFDQLRAQVVQAAQRGVYVSVVLFQSLNATSKKQQDNPWYANPLNRDNNINGINGDTNGNGVGDEAFTLTIPAITTLQEAYIRKVVDTLNNLDNVLYEISADGPLGNPVWQNYIINYLKTYQATKLNQHPIGISYMSGTNTEDVFAGPADWIAVYGADLNPPLATGAKVLFLEANPSLLGDGSSYQSIWKSFTRGFNVVDRELDSLTPGISDRLHGAITQSLAYSQILNLAAMIPSDVICSSGYCLVKPGAEYLAYLPLGGRVVIDFSTAQQNFLVNWFNPITGQTVSSNTVSGGGQVTLNSPFTGEALLHLKIQPQTLTSASTTTTNTGDTSNVTTLSTSSSASTTSTGSKKITVNTPTITPNGASFAGSTSVSLADATGGATIYYTTDGSSPTQSSPRYSGPITISSDVLLKAQAFKNNANPSSVASAWFAKTSAFDFSLGNSGSVSAVAGASVSNTINATLASGSSQALSFTVSGLPSGASGSFSSPTCNPSCSTVLGIATSGSTPTGNFPVTVTSTGGGVTRTTVFTLNVAAPVVVSTLATPTISPNGGSFTNSVSVTLATATLGAQIYYTTDGSSPTQSSKLYNGPMTLTASAIVKAKAFKSGYNPSAEASASFASDLVAYWKFDEGTGTTTLDSSGNGNTGILTNGPQWSAGITGKALYFDGIDDNVTVPNSDSLNLSTSFTLSAWVNPASTFADLRSVLVKNVSYYLYASSDGYCGNGSLLGGFNEINASLVCQPSLLPANTWTHLALINDGSTLTLYRDGVAVTAANVTGTPSTTTGTLQIAASQYGEYFKGLIDEVRIYRRALSATEIQAIYQSQAVAAPLISPKGGTYNDAVSVTMQTATSGASIYYTTDGSTPTQSSTLYSGSMTLTSSKIIKAKALKSGYNGSTETDASFLVTQSFVAQPFSFSLAASGNLSVFAGAAVSNTISATLDSGSSQAISFSISGLPTGATSLFSSASCSPACSTVLNISTTASTPAGNFLITVTSNGGGVTKTTTFTLSVALALTVATPTITPNGGNFSGSTSVAMQTTTSGAAIYYTTDGSTPTQSSTLYTGTMALGISATVNAKAFKSGYNPSAVAAASFTNTGSGNVYYVAKNGSDSNSCAQAQSQSTPKLTITAGLACLSAGATIQIKAGTYAESITGSNFSTKQSGTSYSNATTIQAFGSDVVTLKQGSIILGSPGSGLAYRYVVFKNLILDGERAQNFAIAFGGGANGGAVDHIKLDGIQVKNYLLTAIMIGSPEGVGTDIWLTRVNVHDNGTPQGIVLPGDSSPSYGHCFYIESSNNLIENSECSNQAGYGIHQYYGTIADNIYRYNYIHNTGMGLGRIAFGIALINGTRNQLYGNSVVNNQNGIWVSDQGNMVYNNTVYGNGVNVPCGSVCDNAILLSNSTGAIIKNNIIFGNSINSIANTGTSSVISNNLTIDPKFVDPGASNFRLQSNSPAIDVGTPNIATGITITYNGAAPDTGAFEY